MAAVKKNQPPTVQNTNETVRDAPKMSYQPVGCGQSVPHSAKIKTARISSEESGRFSVKICTSENFPLYGMLQLNFNYWIPCEDTMSHCRNN